MTDAEKAAAWDRVAAAAGQPWQTSTGLGQAVRRIVADVEVEHPPAEPAPIARPRGSW